MNSFTLSQKTIPHLRKFHNAVKQVVPEFDGFIKNDSDVTVLLTVEVTPEIIAAVEAVVPPAADLPDVTPRQIRQALILSGVNLAEIDQAIDDLPEPTRSLAKAEWEYSNAFERNRPLVAQVAAMLGWTPEQLDQLWILAGTL